MKSFEKYTSFGMKQPGRSFNLMTAEDNNTGYRFGFNGKEQDFTINKQDGTKYDFEARIYDPRIGRFLSIDPLAMKYPNQTPYLFANDNPITFIDIFGEKGTMYIQVLIDKNGKPSIDKNTMKNIKKRIENKMENLNVDVKVKIVYSNNIMTRDEFYSRDGADETDSYILIGRGEALDKIAANSKQSGWAAPDSWPSSVNGTSTDKRHFVNVDNMEQYNGESIWEKPYESMEEKTYLTILHEDGHPKFAEHSQNVNENCISCGKVTIGHVPNTIMAPVPYNSKYDNEMIDMLQKLHGKQKEPNAKSKEAAATPKLSPSAKGSTNYEW